MLFTAFLFRRCASSRTRCPDLTFTCTLSPPQSASMKFSAPSCAGWGITRCTGWYTWSARKISISGWPRGRRRNSNGRNGKPARARSSGIHPKIYFQSRSQSHWNSIFLSGADGGVGGDVSVATHAHSPAVAFGGDSPDGGDQAGDVLEPAHHARHHHGVFCADDGAAGRIRKLLSSDPDRSAGHGVSGVEYVVVLDNICCLHSNAGCVLRDWRRSVAWLDGISAVERGAIGGTGGRAGRRFVGHQHCHLLYRVSDGGSEFYYDDARSAGQGHDADAHAADSLVVVYHCNSRTAGLWCAAFGGNFAADGPQHRDQLLCPAGGGKWTDYGP